MVKGRTALYNLELINTFFLAAEVPRHTRMGVEALRRAATVQEFANRGDMRFTLRSRQGFSRSRSGSTESGA